METIKRSVVIGEDGRVLLEGLPAGRAEIRIQVETNGETPTEGSREWIRMKLKAAGLLAELTEDELAEAEMLSEEEEEALADLLGSGGRSTLELINEDREERF